MVMPAAEAGLQRGTLIKQHAESFGNLKSEIIRSTSCSKTGTTSSEPAPRAALASTTGVAIIENERSQNPCPKNECQMFRFDPKIPHVGSIRTA
jgi:hypothetical protein